MIIGFKRKGLRELYETGSMRGVRAAHVPKLEVILAALDAATGPEDLGLAIFRLHPLKGNRQGQWSVWVNGNWRVTFRFLGENIELVDYEDYH